MTAPLAQRQMPGEQDLPHDFGPPMESDQHLRAMNILVDSLNMYWEERDDVHVGGNMAMYFSAEQLKNNDFLGPDVFVVLDTVRRIRKSWVVWEEQRSPDLVIELLSESTEARDRGEKMQIYAKVLRVPEYYLFDPLDGRFEGYRLDLRHNVYTVMKADADGSIRSERLKLRLAVREREWKGQTVPWLRWLDHVGRLIPTPEELARREKRRADALADKLRELGVDPDDVG